MVTNEKKIKSKMKIIFIIMLVILIALLARFAWAKYMNSVRGDTSADIAQWSFNVTAGSEQNLIIDLAKTRYSTDTSSVDKATIAPGTSGELILNINANVTDVSLKYDIDLDISEVPQNLIFYSDSEMKNAFYHEDKNIHIDGFFDCNTEDKSEQKKIYWSWAIETGQTDAQIMQNNLIDSESMGKNITLGIQVTGQQVKRDANSQGTAVTFDANGGIIEGYGNSSQMTKNVTYGETYGELPIPTRDGYTFKGWNGKNLVNYAEIPLHHVECVDGKFYFDGSYNEGNTGNCIDVQTYNDSSYLKIVAREYSKGMFQYIFTKDDSFTSFCIKVNTRIADPYMFISLKNLASEKDYILSFNIESIEEAKATISNIQIEEGSVATTYEPYYISSLTQVTQNKNHTLTAIWEKN